MRVEIILLTGFTLLSIISAVSINGQSNTAGLDVIHEYHIEEELTNSSLPLYPRFNTHQSQGMAYLMLVFQWPESVCASDRRRCHGPIDPNWTLHGVWALDRRLIKCREDFDPSQLNDIRANLTQLWPSYFHKTGDSFWEHEYTKHGSCLSSTVRDYFDMSLKFYSKYAPMVESVLKPSLKTQPLRQWSRPIRELLDSEPMMRCRTNWHPKRRGRRYDINSHHASMSESDSQRESIFESESDPELANDIISIHRHDQRRRPRPQRDHQRGGPHHLLVEIGLCFDRDDQPVDCPMNGRIRGCRSGDDVMLPPVGTFEFEA